MQQAVGPWTPMRALVVALIGLGAGIFTYPSAADWFSQANYAVDISGYAEAVEHTPSEEVQRMLDAAHEYNANLPNGPLRDPYALGADGKALPLGEGREIYERLLAEGPKRVMARVQIPKIHVDMPVYHDTDAATLDAGVGHLYGSALPVGGVGTHSVLTAHTGLVSSKMFTDLTRLVVGDRFTIQVLSETLSYEVDQIDTVLPTELESLRQVHGEDYVTLVTCTPVGINTHRLLVRGTRVPNDELTGFVQPGIPGPGFPWWVLPVPGALVAGVVLTRPSRRSPNTPPGRRPRSSAPAASASRQRLRSPGPRPTP